jgi:cellulose synthase/poly-beta-1,6-N-acetylglucosamine synthase-like glycosyltransferase
MTLLSGRPRSWQQSSRTLRFDVIVPAHDEMATIAPCIASLRAIAWPFDRFRVVVVADNCSDDTARIAATAGAEVLERNDPSKRGKGYALQYAFAASRDHGFADAVVVVDADAAVSPNILESFAVRLEAGAHAVQSHYGVRNPMSSWRTRLITIAKGSFHIVRSRARQRLGLSCGLRGNGWCVTHHLLKEVAYQAFSIAEDLEYGINIGLAGYSVAYADEAHADADMVTSEEIARGQRQRWEQGRFQLIREKTLPLLAHALRLRSKLCLDLALDLLVPPLSYIALGIGALLLLSLGAWHFGLGPFWWVSIGMGCCFCLVAYVGRGWQLSGVGAQGVWDLARVPWFIAWKLWLLTRRSGSKEWVRTRREV